MSAPLARMLAHPLRDRVLFEYQREPASPSQVARRLRRPVNLISYHTGVLARHGCVELVRTERSRGAVVHFYRATVRQEIDDDDWGRLPLPLKRALALATLQRLTEEAHDAAFAAGFDAQAAVLARVQLMLDDEGRRAVSRLLRRTLDELTEIAQASRARPAAGRRLHEVALLAFAPNAAAPRRSDGNA